MKYAVFAVIFCIGLAAWYLQDERPAAVHAPKPVQPSTDLTPSGRQRLAVGDLPCAEFVAGKEWQQLKAVYAGMSDADLCSFVRAPEVSKLDGVNVNPQAAEVLLNELLNEPDDDSAQLANVPDLRYYLDPQAIESIRGLGAAQLVAKINAERSPEAAYLLAQRYHEDEKTYLMLMLSAASYSQKPGPLLNAINGCCSWTPNDAAGERAAAIRREALIMIARELNLPEARDWREFDLDPEIEAEVLAQRAAFVAELNQYSMEAFGEEWIQ